MASDILNMARREAEALRSTLARNPEYQKLQQIQKLIDVYESLEITSEDKPRTETTTVSPPTASGVAAVYRLGSKVAQVDEVVSKFFLERGSRASSGDVLPIVTAAGIEMTGKIPAKTLSSFLTNSKRFNNVKGFGYGLVEWGETLGPKASPSNMVDFANPRSDALGARSVENNSGAGDDRS